MKLTLVCHRDGTVTYWSVYSQSWERRVSVLPTREVVAMSKSDRNRVLRHLERAYDLRHPDDQ